MRLLREKFGSNEALKASQRLSLQQHQLTILSPNHTNRRSRCATPLFRHYAMPAISTKAPAPPVVLNSSGEENATATLNAERRESAVPQDVEEQRIPEVPKTRKVTGKIRKSTAFPTIMKLREVRMKGGKIKASQNRTVETHADTDRRERVSLLTGFRKATNTEPGQSQSRITSSTSSARSWSKDQVVQKPDYETVKGHDLTFEPLSADRQPTIPRLSFDLSRVLFNPGVYHLRDPRSRVYNFDPYLEHPMPMKEFNFEALNAYVTSSEDHSLIALAKRYQKRYVGSSSSLASVMAQFHFLISQLRDLSTGRMSRDFEDAGIKVTQVQRAPASIFLRYKEGVYAVDADKGQDGPNVLMGLGKSLEKLLTLEKSEIEKWRRTGSSSDQKFKDANEEAFHYSGQGQLLLRSQLDACDPRLPGSGVFDLKTRAVAGIRMNMSGYETGMGYQIKTPTGTWESFEREYFDMMRAAFLKYSIQVRMGRMDGVFVAYHNIGQIFGFQYIPLAEMDAVLHGQEDPCLGDQEFKLSIKLLNEIFDAATKEFPDQSMRLLLETRDTGIGEPKPYMYIFAEPMTDEAIDTVQNASAVESAKFEKKHFYGEDGIQPEIEKNFSSLEDAIKVQELTSSTRNEAQKESGAPPEATNSTKKQLSDEVKSDGARTMKSDEYTTTADKVVLDQILDKVPRDQQPSKIPPLMAFKLRIQNKVNNIGVVRPTNLSPKAKWSLDYNLERMDDDTAHKAHIHCKNRRMALLTFEKKNGLHFSQMLRRMSEQGAEWRREMDQRDAKKDVVVLYPTHVQSTK